MRCVKCGFDLWEGQNVCPSCRTIMIPMYIAQKDEYTLTDDSEFTDGIVFPEDCTIGFEAGTVKAGMRGMPENIFINTLILPDSVRYIASGGFFDRDIRNVRLSENLEEIGEYAFSGCTFEHMELPDRVKKIGDGAFENCQQLKSIKLPAGLEEIGQNAFSTCISLESIDIPETVSHIDRFVFQSCFELKEITIPQNVKYIDSYCFAMCNKLETIRLPKDCRITEVTRTASSYDEETVDSFESCSASIIRY